MVLPAASATSSRATAEESVRMVNAAPCQTVRQVELSDGGCAGPLRRGNHRRLNGFVFFVVDVVPSQDLAVVAYGRAECEATLGR